MRTDPIALIGAGGHARVVLDALLAAGQAPASIAVTAAPDGSGDQRRLLGVPVHEPEFAEAIAGRGVHVAIGDNATRMRLLAAAHARGHALATIRHPRSVVSESARVADGVFIAALAVVGPQSEVGSGTIVNHAAIVDHDCRIGAGAHVAPGAVLGGGVCVGEGAFVGANATVLPGRSVGAGATVGAGAVVTRDISPHTIVVGSPARPNMTEKES